MQVKCKMCEKDIEGVGFVKVRSRVEVDVGKLMDVEIIICSECEKKLSGNVGIGISAKVEERHR